jgi:putative DNA methylase
MSNIAYPKRLIEVDLPIKKISAHARREKSIRQGHISTLHIWWARRPLASCRAVICAALWPDPAQDDCPPKFREDAASIMAHFWNPIGRTDLDFSAPLTLRQALLDFIADFSNWDNSTRKEYLETARALTQSAHVALGGASGTRPLVVDPFAGGGSIPLEALRVGADAFASDLNPVAVLLNKVVLEYIPKYGQTLADEVRKWGEWIRVEAEKELGQFYPKDPDGATPIAYLWARTITCEGPGCGAEVPLMRSLWLEKNRKRSVALRLVPHAQSKEIGFEIIGKVGNIDVARGTSAGGAATCPICGFTTKVESVRSQLTDRHGGASDARLIAIVTARAREKGHGFRLTTSFDEKVAQSAAMELQRQVSTNNDVLPLIPDGAINHLRGFFNIVLYGITNWGDLFTPRQILTLTTFARLIHDPRLIEGLGSNRELSEGVRTCLALILDRVAVRCTSNCIWDATTKSIMQVFNQGQSLPARWEFMEMNPIIDQGSGWNTSLEYALKVIEHCQSIDRCGIADLASATKHPLSDDAASAIITDPPYYAAVPYADLSDFFYSWLKRSMLNLHPELFRTNLVAKDEEIVSLSHRASMYRQKDNAWFEHQMQMACEQGRRVCDPAGIGVFVFANKETSAWEAMLAALIKAGWIVTASWPIDTKAGTGFEPKIPRLSLPPFTSSAARVRVSTAQFVQTMSAIGATCWQSFPCASTPGCPAWLPRALWAQMPSSLALVRPWRFTAATHG